MANPSDRKPFSVLMTGSLPRLACAAVPVTVLWLAVVWALAGSAA